MPRWNVSELYFFVCLFEESLERDESGKRGATPRRRKQRQRNKKNENRPQTYKVALSSPMAFEGHESGMNFYR